MKFGGAALADGASVRAACGIVARHGGAHPIVVVSAPGGITALLDGAIRAAARGLLEGDRVRIRCRTLLAQLGFEGDFLDRILSQLFGVLNAVREEGRVDAARRDFVLAAGERMSARILARALREASLPASPVDAFDIGLRTDSQHGAARPLAEALSAVARFLDAFPGIPVVTGFLAADCGGNVTTLGPDGSDLTAAWIAEAVGAEAADFWKPVGSVMTADPALVPGALPIERLSYESAAVYARAGANVLHAGALEPLARASIPARIRSSRDPLVPGTRIESGPGTSACLGVACRRPLARIVSGRGEASLQRAFDACRELRSDLRPLVVRPGDAGRSLTLLSYEGGFAELRETLDDRATLEGPFAAVSLAGGAAEGPRAWSELLEAGIPVHEVGLGSDGRSPYFLVDLDRAAAACCLLHREWFETPRGSRLETRASPGET